MLIILSTKSVSHAAPWIGLYGVLALKSWPVGSIYLSVRIFSKLKGEKLPKMMIIIFEIRFWLLI